MKKQIIPGLIAGLLSLATALFVILSATLNDMILSVIRAAMFSRPGLWVPQSPGKKHGLPDITSSPVATPSVLIANTLSLLYLSLPAVLCLGVGDTLFFMEPEEKGAESADP